MLHDALHDRWMLCSNYFVDFDAERDEGSLEGSNLENLVLFKDLIGHFKDLSGHFKDLSDHFRNLHSPGSNHDVHAAEDLEALV